MICGMKINFQYKMIILKKIQYLLVLHAGILTKKDKTTLVYLHIILENFYKIGFLRKV